MKKLTFQQQFWLGGIVFVLTIILSHVLQIGFIHNLGWIIYGLLLSSTLCRRRTSMVSRRS